MEGNSCEWRRRCSDEGVVLVLVVFELYRLLNAGELSVVFEIVVVSVFLVFLDVIFESLLPKQRFKLEYKEIMRLVTVYQALLLLCILIMYVLLIN